MSATTHTPRETLRKTAHILERVGVALYCAPEPIARALHEHEQEPGNEWQRIEASSLITDAAYYAHEDRPALVVYYDEGKGQGVMFIEGHPDDAADSARHCAAQHRARAWWVVLTDERPEWNEVPR